MKTGSFNSSNGLYFRNTGFEKLNQKKYKSDFHRVYARLQTRIHFCWANFELQVYAHVTKRLSDWAMNIALEIGEFVLKIKFMNLMDNRIVDNKSVEWIALGWPRIARYIFYALSKPTLTLADLYVAI